MPEPKETPTAWARAIQADFEAIATTWRESERDRVLKETLAELSAVKAKSGACELWRAEAMAAEAWELTGVPGKAGQLAKAWHNARKARLAALKAVGVEGGEAQ